MISISKNVHFDKLDDKVDKCNNTYYITFKMKPADEKLSKYTDSSKEINEKEPQFKIGNIVRISKYQNIFPRDYTPNWSKEIIVIKEDCGHVINDLIRKKSLEPFTKKNCKKQTKNN